MTQEEKELLLKDICARLPYGIKISPKEKDTGEYDISSGRNYMYPDVIEVDAFIPDGDNTRIEYGDWIVYLDNIQLYLRPMSSMTEEEKKEFGNISGLYKNKEFEHFINLNPNLPRGFNCTISEVIMSTSIDWLNAHHFDYHGLIEKGLAIAVTDENNPYK